MRGVRTIKSLEYSAGDRVLLRNRIYNVQDVGNVIHTMTFKMVPALRLEGWIHSPYVLAQNCRKIIKISPDAHTIKGKVLC